MNAINTHVTVLSDGYEMSGGKTSVRKLKITGGDVTFTGSGSNTYTFPTSSDTLAGLAATQTLTNKTIDYESNTIQNLPFGKIIDVYDGAGGTTISTQATCVMNTTRKNTDSGLYTLASNAIDVADAGTYMIIFRGSADATTATRTVVQWNLQVNGSDVTAGVVYSYHRLTTDGEATGEGVVIMDLSAGDDVSLTHTLIGSAAAVTIQYGSAIQIIKIA